MAVINMEGTDYVFEQDFQDDRMNDKILISYYMQVEELVQKIVEKREGELVARLVPCGESLVISLSPTGSLLKGLLETGCHHACSQFNYFNNNPLFKAYHDAAKWYQEDKILSGVHDFYEASRLNRVAYGIRNSIDISALARMRYRRNKAMAKRFKSVSLYMDSIRNRYSRINCLRIDFGYCKGKFFESKNHIQDLEIVKSHWDKMRLDLFRGVPISDVVGFVVRLEYGIFAGFHFHALIMLDGSKRQQDISLAQVIGEHWVNVIVPNREGRYYNCNRHKNSYHQLGIGIINYFDDSKYKVLKDVVLMYMIKSDCLMDLISPGERSMFRGKYHQANGTTKGRPRRNY